MDTSAHLVMYASSIHSTQRDGGDGADAFIADLLPRLMEFGNEFLAALDGIRLCAPGYVIAEAEAAAKSIPNIGLEPDDFQQAVVAYRAAHGRFIDAARRDLAYGAAWWNVWRKTKEWWFVRQHYSKPSAERQGGGPHLGAGSAPPPSSA
ncbi:hypothetical protein ACFW6S_31535 [Streptomyces sp. NPDC058740]|uniref:hypothetical protein n=1 Tax=Streptomyces sp. NPDC058740 TaxID=3346619 RepID=UPI0036C7760B